MYISCVNTVVHFVELVADFIYKVICKSDIIIALWVCMSTLEDDCLSWLTAPFGTEYLSGETPFETSQPMGPTTLLYEMPSNSKGKNFVSKIQRNKPQNRRVFYLQKVIPSNSECPHILIQIPSKGECKMPSDFWWKKKVLPLW